MSNTKHTPGPWHTEAGNKGIENFIYTHPNIFIAACTGLAPDSVIEANAKLIAAAPELLEVLTTVYTSFKNRGFFAAGHDKVLGDKMYAAIKKATE